MLKILLALKEPPEEIAALINEHLVETIAENSSPEEAIRNSNHDVAVIEGDLEKLASIKECDPRVEVILFGHEKSLALEAIKDGATAYFTLPFVDRDAFTGVIDRIDELSILRRETFELERNLSDKYQFQGIVGRNPVMIDIFNFIRRIAHYYRAVTVTGETGTGKELIAKAVHDVSPVASEPFITFNCGGIVDTLIESELFGHKKGAFTGAFEDKAGLFEVAGSGTLFLDEISNMPLSVQPHLLRVLQDGDFRRLGSTATLNAKCRVIAASNRDLSGEVKNGNFRDDLFFRLTPLKISVPPLRERKDDLPLLFNYFLKKFTARTGKSVKGISRPAQTQLLSYDWPGNIRELENVIEQAAILTSESFIRPEDLPESIKEFKGAVKYGMETLDKVVRAHIESVLNKCDGNRTHASKLLGISRRSLIRKIDKYTIK